MEAAAWAEALLNRHWWRPRRSLLTLALLPLSWLYGLLFRMHRALNRPRRAPVPVLVVGNLVAGGAGKTPTVIALVQALKRSGLRAGVVSRGYGRRASAPRAVQAGCQASEVGDEPWLIQRRTGVPVWVGSDRLAVARVLCKHHPEVDLLVLDDGLQHHALAHDVAVVVFDERGVGNSALLPAGPLREPLRCPAPSHWRVLYTAGRRSTALPGSLAHRRLGPAWPLAAWHAADPGLCQPVQALRGRRLLAAAGLAAPEKFFGMLETAGLQIERLPLPDHHHYDTLPWPDGTTEVVTTEKDAAKLDAARTGNTAVWVLPLDLQLPEGFAAELVALLHHNAHPPSGP